MNKLIFSIVGILRDTLKTSYFGTSYCKKRNNKVGNPCSDEFRWLSPETEYDSVKLCLSLTPSQFPAPVSIWKVVMCIIFLTLASLVVDRNNWGKGKYKGKLHGSRRRLVHTKWSWKAIGQMVQYVQVKKWKDRAFSQHCHRLAVYYH